jgi:hypothetical protein
MFMHLKKTNYQLGVGFLILVINWSLNTALIPNYSFYGATIAAGLANLAGLIIGLLLIIRMTKKRLIFMHKSSLIVFANFRIDNKERYQRMQDSFLSFKNIYTEKWIINIRGLYKEEAFHFLQGHLKNMKIFSNRFFGINDGQSMKRIVESILRSINS